MKNVHQHHSVLVPCNHIRLYSEQFNIAGKLASIEMPYIGVNLAVSVSHKVMIQGLNSRACGA